MLVSVGDSDGAFCLAVRGGMVFLLLLLLSVEEKKESKNILQVSSM